MTIVKLGKFISEYSCRNKEGKDLPVYSVTNSNGFCTEYFTKDVSSRDKTNYKIVPFGYFAYNPSRINVGSIDCQEEEEEVIVSPLYTVFKCSNEINTSFLKYYFKSRYGKNLISSRTSGSVRANLKFNILCEFDIPLVSLTEQKAIVDVLNKINDLIAKEEKELLLCDELIKSRFAELFSACKDIVCFDEVMIDDTKFGYKFDSSCYQPSGEISIVDQGKNLICGYKNKDDKKPPYCKECIIFGDHTEVFKYVDFPIYLGADGTKILRVKDGWNTRFVYEYLNFSYIPVGGYSRHFKFLKEQTFIKPSIESQNEFANFVNTVNSLKNNISKRIKYYQELLNKKMDEFFNKR